ncbi:hypothetical protein BTZ20_3449 [Rhodococcus sp. MTM3W5.2]|uniref:hypothetical protein n=1 Tax=Rhodococcus sp. MTM3W5.2 TaxID=1805827 RepID=UPI0009796A12|nr:hypothetical protein [Rhodococcus sp. MTM3W5.2]AQA22792.1 hypothetical protein BTZ20_3449 [Rhodococcus sp. MTM3W5.2]
MGGGCARGLLLAVVAVGVLTARSQPAEPDPRGSDSATSANPYEQARRAGVQDLLNRWAGAVRGGDTDALAALFDRAAAPEFLASEIRRSEHLAAVPLADWGYEIGSDPETPVPTDLAEQLDATDVWAVPAYLRYAIEGADAGSTRKPVSLIVARRGRTGPWSPIGHSPSTDAIPGGALGISVRSSCERWRPVRTRRWYSVTPIRRS